MPSKDSLINRHQCLEIQIADELKRPVPDSLHITQLKKEKLLIKQQIIS